MITGKPAGRRRVGLQLVWPFLLLIGLAGAAATALSVPTGCPDNGLVDCRAVLATGAVAGIPVWGWGFLWAAAGCTRLGRSAVWAVAGLLGLGWAVGNEVAAGHLCLWCTVAQVGLAGWAVSRLLAAGARRASPPGQR
ncbi:membrane protein of unknown function [Candidatus Hydrogenisulfobacillus filiaventi]|uniref:Vitamin K epoxide reductase domain-containing protein n=1 Tax=Candidatus Hydrogenisulfobacillus filiaventi TaxID=2707344 RepID=A0A6F8ZJC5_9FIRM|nr:hypothetical protein [Bacillota bacterium]CAB1129835.1 membrane protein of unknown function [Candidatus Hydrogenisulfobacillus filiaventi]